MSTVIALKRESGKSLSEAVDFYSSKLAKKFLSLEWEKGDVYQRWMTEHYHLVRRTMRYINMGAGLSEVHDEGTYKYWTHHLKEEINHHKVLEKDAERFGLKLSQTQPLPITNALARVIHYGMIDSHGMYLFGYGPLLEGLAVHAAAKVADRIEAKFEAGSAKFLRLHADVDDGDHGHYVTMKKYMDSLSPEQQSQIKEALEVSYSLYSELLSAISGEK